MSCFDPALAVANAVLYEGYLLYPYTASARKNQMRWQFGVVVPQAYARAGSGEAAEQQTEVLLEHEGAPLVEVRLRFLQVEARRVESRSGASFEPVDSLAVNGTTHLTFDEAIARAVTVRLSPLKTAVMVTALAFDGRRESELLREADGEVRGRIVRETWPLRGTLSVFSEPAPEAAALLKLRVRLENQSDVIAGGSRRAVLRTAFVSAHTLLHAEDGRFLSLLDPPDLAAEASAALRNEGTWPVLVGDEKADAQRAALLLSSPIILYDFPAVAPQSRADAFDATEIDELLTLSVLGLSDSEREEARATDPRARAIVERAERFGPEELERIHRGALRRTASPDPFAALDVPSIDCVFVEGTRVAKGSAVRLRPKRRADVMDTFLADKRATVRAIHQDLENQLYVAVTVDDDPASDLHEWYGRSFFFYPDEIEPLGGLT